MIICPHCKQENRDSARFCDNCGQKLAHLCPTCQHEVRPEAKFCDNCGNPLAAQPEADLAATHANATTELDRFIPRALAEKLQSSRASGAMVGERRIVTMLFCDLRGSTAAAETLDPEDWTDIMNGAFEYMIGPVYTYEGTVARLMGDAILAFFGAPIAHEDDPQRAILAGMEIVAGIQPYRDDVKKKWGIEIDVRVGVNTGLVVVGAVGSDLRMEYTAMGDAINLAARMEQTAAPGTVQVAEATYLQADHFFEFERLGGVQVKGKSESVTTYRPLRLKATPDPQRGIAGLESPLVGRDQEWDQLNAGVEGLRNGVGGIIFLRGEAGLGKSRLVEELKEAVKSEAALAWYETEALSYETAQPYALFQRLLRGVIGASEQDGLDTLALRLDELIAADLPDQSPSARQVLGGLLGLPDRSGLPPLEGEGFKGQLYVIMRQLWERKARDLATILFCDDLHWADAASIDLLIDLLQVSEAAPLLIICATRPERDTFAWQLRLTAEHDYPHRWLEIDIQPLNKSDSGQLIDNLLQIPALPAALRQNIQAHSEGNPFFVEEVIRTLIDRGILAHQDEGWQLVGDNHEIDLPENLQALLTARIDQLAPGPRHTLQTASVLGRAFYHRVLAHIKQEETILEEELIALQRQEFIRIAARIPELEYLFRHALMQDAAYSTILLKERRRFHRQAAEALEALYNERLDELAAAIALHYDQAQAYAQAGAFYRRAGDRAYQLYASAEAVRHYQAALACADKASLNADDLIHLHTRLGRALELNDQFDQAMETYLRLDELAQHLTEPRLKLWSLVSRAVLHATHTPFVDSTKAQRTALEAIALAQELGEPEAEARASWAMLLVYFFLDANPEEARKYGEASLAIAREHKLQSQLMYTLNDLVRIYTLLFEVDQAIHVSREARQGLEEIGNLPMLADNLNFAAGLHVLRGELSAAKTANQEGYEIARSIDNSWNQAVALERISIAHLESGAIGECLDSAQRGFDLSISVDLISSLVYCTCHLGLAYAELGEYEEGLAAMGRLEAYDLSAMPFWLLASVYGAQIKLHLGQKDMEAAREVRRKLGGEDDMLLLPFTYALLPAPFMTIELALAEGDYETVIRMAAYFAAAAQRSDFPMALPDLWYYEAQARMAQGQFEAAQDALNRARAMASGFGANRILWKITARLAEVEHRLGHVEDAEAMRREAAALIESIAAQHGLEPYRDTFLALPEVQAVLAV